MVTKTRALWECSFCNEEFTGVILGHMRGHFSGNKLIATAAGICACPEANPEVAEAFHGPSIQRFSSLEPTSAHICFSKKTYATLQLVVTRWTTRAVLECSRRT